MLVYFSANHRHLERDLPTYRQIVKAIQENGHVIVDNWVEAAYHTHRQANPERDWTAICMSAQAGIEDADMVIAEATGESGFGVGFEVASAQALKKPILILVRAGESADSYSSGLSQLDLTYAEYEMSNLADRVMTFLKETSR